MPGWKFVTNHALVLCQIAEQPRITIREISMNIGITEKATHRIITELEEEGYVTKRREGRCLRYLINSHLPIRTETQHSKAIGNLLEILGWDKHQSAIEKKEAKVQV